MIGQNPPGGYLLFRFLEYYRIIINHKLLSLWLIIDHALLNSRLALSRWNEIRILNNCKILLFNFSFFYLHFDTAHIGLLYLGLAFDSCHKVNIPSYSM